MTATGPPMELVGGVSLAEWERAPGRRLREIVDAYRESDPVLTTQRV